jgi:hypothetical protein
VTDIVVVSPAWLALRESADARARSRTLALAAARRAMVPIEVHDVGSGTGSMMRWLVPLLPAPQAWMLHDWNFELLEHAAASPVRDRTGEAVTVRTRVGEIADLTGADLAGATLVTSSALLDVLTRGEVEALVRACVDAGAPALLGLTVTGAVDLEPVDPGDLVFASAFNAHQRRTVGDRQLLGPDGAGVATELFRAHGWSVRSADAPWRLRSSDRELIIEWLDGWLAAAVEARPALTEWAEEYLATRAAQLARGELRVTVHHRDLLAWPP